MELRNLRRCVRGSEVECSDAGIGQNFEYDLVYILKHPNPDPGTKDLSRDGNLYVTINVHICVAVCST
jgi:hypothetical protein